MSLLAMGVKLASHASALSRDPLTLINWKCIAGLRLTVMMTTSLPDYPFLCLLCCLVYLHNYEMASSISSMPFNHARIFVSIFLYVIFK